MMMQLQDFDAAISPPCNLLKRISSLHLFERISIFSMHPTVCRGEAQRTRLDETSENLQRVNTPHCNPYKLATENAFIEPHLLLMLTYISKSNPWKVIMEPHLLLMLTYISKSNPWNIIQRSRESCNPSQEENVAMCFSYSIRFLLIL